MKRINALVRNNRGVSEVVGAMLLIVVAIIAVSGVAVMVAEMQKNAAERQSNIEAIENENLKIMSIIPTLNDTDPTRFSALRINVMNLNSQESRVAAVLINGRPADNITSTDQYNTPRNFSYYDRLIIPAGQSRNIDVNFSGDANSFANGHNVSALETLKITIFTAGANTFTRIFTPPKALIKTSIETEDIGVAQRDILLLDGSDSFDDGSITGYNWSIGNVTGNAGNYTGRKVRVTLNQAGPFFVNLTVIDETGMRGVSENLMIPKNERFNPPVSLSVSYTTGLPGTLEATVKDIQGNPVPGVGVSFITMTGNPNPTPAAGVTNSLGQVSTNVTPGPGNYIQVRSGKMNPVDIEIT